MELGGVGHMREPCAGRVSPRDRAGLEEAVSGDVWGSRRTEHICEVQERALKVKS